MESSTARNSLGSALHVDGPKCENARSVYLVHSRGSEYSPTLTLSKVLGVNGWWRWALLSFVWYTVNDLMHETTKFEVNPPKNRKEMQLEKTWHDVFSWTHIKNQPSHNILQPLWWRDCRLWYSRQLYTQTSLTR